RPNQGWEGSGTPRLWWGIVMPRLFALALAAPPRTLSTLKRRVAHRSDWDVIVYCGEDEKRNSALVENHASMEQAAARADVLWQHLEQHDELPGSANRDAH